MIRQGQISLKLWIPRLKLQAIDANLASSIQRVSGKYSISVQRSLSLWTKKFYATFDSPPSIFRKWIVSSKRCINILYIYIYICEFFFFFVVGPKREKSKNFKMNRFNERFVFFKNYLFPSYIHLCFHTSKFEFHWVLHSYSLEPHMSSDNSNSWKHTHI